LNFVSIFFFRFRGCIFFLSRSVYESFQIPSLFLSITTKSLRAHHLLRFLLAVSLPCQKYKRNQMLRLNRRRKLLRQLTKLKVKMVISQQAHRTLHYAVYATRIPPSTSVRDAVFLSESHLCQSQPIANKRFAQLLCRM
jgi:tetrahydrodipicolinate N-succinyltransferase